MIKDSGSRTNFDSGAVRDIQEVLDTMNKMDGEENEKE